MKKILTLIIFLVLFILVSINIFENAKNWVSEYNIGGSLYKLEKYEDSFKKYKSLEKCDFKEFCFRLYHNIGNTLFKLGEQKNNTEEIKKLWNEAINNYKKALEIKYDDETKSNLEYVKEKLKSLEDNKKEDLSTSDNLEKDW